MIRVLMYGPKAVSGGVAIHTKNLIHELEKLGVVVIFHYCSGSIFNRLYQRTVGLILVAINKKREYDIIHIQSSGGFFSFIAALTGAIVSRILSKKLVITFHHSKTQKFVKNNKFLFKFVLRCSNTMILVSHKQKGEILKICGNFFPEKLIVITNGFNKTHHKITDKAIFRAYLKLPLEKKIIFNISNLIESKGHVYLLYAMSRICTVNKDCLCFIAGMGNYEKILKKVLTNLKLDDCVTFLGWIPDDEIPLWLIAADLFVHPSLHEGNPTVMFESLGCGTPFVGTNVGGVPEVIKSDEYGFLVEPANAMDLAEKILIAINRKWDHNIIINYAEQFTWENIAIQTINLYKKIEI